ncbi:glycosyltransferase family 39 protein [Alkalilimnicola ehrlichii]|uniref:glycosyltransferase family 39 protein n=1 Tax=Alkalilimnicola ehrlichii TaxID=351052 RepID=UPI0015F27A68|nr:glycosyltransferase family 39 protein [Alkalilimnicola ehrlichii]
MELRSAYPVSDAFFYWQAAWYRAFIDADGGFIGTFIPNGPYVWSLTQFYRWLGPGAAVPFLLHAVLLSAAAAFMALLSRELFDARTGWIAGLLTAFCGPLVFFAGLTVKTNVILCLIAASLWCFFRYLNHRTAWPWLLLAVLLASLATLERHNIGFLPLFYLGYALLLALRMPQPGAAVARTVAAFGGALVVFTLVSGWDWRQPEQEFFAPVGLNVYVGNAPGSRGGYTPVEGLRNDVLGHFLHAAPFTREKLGYEASREEVSAYWVRKSVDYYSNRPAEYLQLQLRKLGLLLAAEGYGLPEQYSVWRWKRPALAAAIVDGAVILSLAGGALLVWPVLRRYPAARFLLLCALTYAATQWLFFVGERYRLTLYLLLLPFAAVGVRWALQAVWRQRVIYAAVVGLLFGGSHALTSLLDHGAGWAADRHAQAAWELEQVHALTPFYDAQIAVANGAGWPAWAELGRTALAMGFLPDAEYYARQAVSRRGESIEPFLLLAEILLATDDHYAQEQLWLLLSQVTVTTPQQARELQKIRQLLR